MTPARSSATSASRSVTPSRSGAIAKADSPATSGAGLSSRSTGASGKGLSPVSTIRRGDSPRVTPAHRPAIDHHAARPFHCAGHHYFGYRIHALPPHCVHHLYWGLDYWYWEGCYYRFWDDYYYICRPPYYTWFDIGLYELDLLAVRLAYYNTIDYQYDIINENYGTIAEQHATIAANNATIAAQNESIAAGSEKASESYELAKSLGLVQSYAAADQTYYYDDGIFFIEKDGQYYTIVPPAGAIVETLPDDYETVTLGGQTYYKVDDTIYRTVILDGKAVFEVLGQQQTAQQQA